MSGSWRQKLQHSGGAAFGLAVLAAVGYLLWKQLSGHPLEEIFQDVLQLPLERIALAAFLMFLHYVVLASFEQMTLMYYQKPLTLPRLALGTFVAYTLSLNFGWVLGGPVGRYRIYRRWGFTPLDLVKLAALVGVTYWVALHLFAGLVFMAAPIRIPPIQIPDRLHLQSQSTFWYGVIFAGVSLVYLAACAIWQKPLRWGTWELQLPSARLSLWLSLLATADLTLAAGVLYVMLPPDLTTGGFPVFLNIFLFSTVAVYLSHVPGGAGVFELVMATLLTADPAQRPTALGVLLAYRGLFYLLPLALSLIAWGVFEIVDRLRLVPPPLTAPTSTDAPP